MLTHLYVRNLAVVEAAEIELETGLTVVTGETGAGKSLLVDALLLLSGARGAAELVRNDSERAELSAELDIAEHAGARAWLRAQEMDDGDSCQLRRVLKSGGRSRAWINGRPATLGQLGELASQVVEIHGQHEHQALLSRRHQLDLLDAFADAGELLETVRTNARNWHDLDEQINAAGGSDRAGRMELLQHELAQLDQQDVSADGVHKLEAEHRRLAHADRLLEGANSLRELLDGEHDLAVTHVLGRARSELASLCELDASFQACSELLDNAEIQLGELVHALTAQADGLQPDPARLAELDSRLSHLHDLARRHQVAVTELADKRAQLADELDTLAHAGTHLAQLKKQRAACKKRYAQAAAKLGKARTAAAARLGEQVSSLMQELGMAGGRFEVRIQAQANEQPHASGNERCEFEVSANPGQALQALRKVASGGELSRISLAIRVAALHSEHAACMVFDEVDSGIGGAVAEVVGRKLRELGRTSQVLCVTHLPQVAAQAHAHLRVTKSSDATSTQTQVVALDDAGRRDEVARMLGGIEISDASRAHAEQMLKQAQAG